MADERNPRFLYDYKLRFGTPLNLTKVLNESSSFTQPLDLDKNVQSSKDKNNAYELTTHQISFTINKDSGKDPNKAEIKIYNLDDNLVNYASNNVNNTLAVVFEAGYVGELKTIFKGTVAKVIDKWNGNTRETTLKCTDGGVNIKEAVTSRSYPAGTPVKNVVKDLAADLGTTIGAIEIDTDQTTFNSPISFMGSTSNQLAHLADSINHNYSIQDGAVYITPRSKKLPQQSAYLSDGTGLKSGPEPLTQGEKKNKKNKNPTDGFSLVCQLDGAILPESTIYVKARGYDGAFKVTKVTHTGNFEGNDWTTRVTAIKIDASIAK